MTHTETIEKAIQIAEANGFVFPSGLDDVSYDPVNETWPAIVYRQDFAKALWGKNKVTVHSVKAVLGSEIASVVSDIAIWEIRLQQMVIAPDPLQYLADHLPDEN